VLQEAVNEVVVYVATTPSQHFKRLNNKQTNTNTPSVSHLWNSWLEQQTNN